MSIPVTQLRNRRSEPAAGLPAMTGLRTCVTDQSRDVGDTSGQLLPSIRAVVRAPDAVGLCPALAVVDGAQKISDGKSR